MEFFIKSEAIPVVQLEIMINVMAMQNALIRTVAKRLAKTDEEEDSILDEIEETASMLRKAIQEVIYTEHGAVDFSNIIKK